MSWRQTCQIFWRMTFAVNLIQKYPVAVNFLVESLYRWQPLSRLLWASCLPWDCWSKLDSLPNLSEMRWSTSCRMEYHIYTWSYQGNHVIMCSSNVPYTRQDVLNAEFVFGVATFSSGLFLPTMISFNCDHFWRNQTRQKNIWQHWSNYRPKWTRRTSILGACVV